MSKKPKQIGLQEATDDQLVAEFKRRHPCVILYTYYREEDAEPMSSVRWSGTLWEALGLMDIGQTTLRLVVSKRVETELT